MGYRSLRDESHIVHMWVKDGSHMGYRVGHRWVVDQSHVGRTLLDMSVSQSPTFTSPRPPPHQPLFEDTDSWLTEVGHQTNNISQCYTLFNIEKLSCALSTRFEPLYTNMYHIDPSDGAVLRYALTLKIYGVTSVYRSQMSLHEVLIRIMWNLRKNSSNSPKNCVKFF